MDLLEAAKNVSIVDIAREMTGMNVVRVGSGYQTACPFHNDEKPSLSFDEKTNTFKCFGCSTNGSALDLLVKLNLAVNIVDAAKQIVVRYGLSSSVAVGGGGNSVPLPAAGFKSVAKTASKSPDKKKEGPYTLAVYSEEKKIPLEFLKELGVRDYYSKVTKNRKI